MTEWMLVRSVALRMNAGGNMRLLRALDEWTASNAEWLGLVDTDKWPQAIAALQQDRTNEPRPHVLALADVLAATLALSDIDAALLRLLVAADRLPRFASLTATWSEHGRDLPMLLGMAAGADPVDADRAVRSSAVLRMGLASFSANRQGMIEVDLRWSLEKLLDRASADHHSVIAALVGPVQTTHLALADFAHVGDADFLVRLLAGSSLERAAGVNILIYGPPGTGKTEFARSLAATAGLALYGVGEADDDGDEPTRWDRVCALQLAQRVMARRGDAVLLFDEMEDLIGDAHPSTGDWQVGRNGSKVFVNRLLETNAVPVIWTTNALGNIEDAILRRMSFVLRLDLPSPATARRMMTRIAAEESVTSSPQLEALVDQAPETATVLRVAARAARLAGEVDGIGRPAAALVRALRGTELPRPDSGELDLDLFEADCALGPMLTRLRESGGGDVSVLLTGPPGTGKSALAAHMARAVDRPLMIKRASDLLSRWVGGTEAAIAEAFAEARERGQVLFFDEADSLLFDRSSAAHSWEVGQVNEMLTWLDQHPLPVIAATNHGQRLDAAAVRRFAFKIDLAPLGASRAAQAFQRFFGVPAPGSLARVTNLTPGDFAAVRRQLRFAPARDALDLVERLGKEGSWRPGCSKLGF